MIDQNYIEARIYDLFRQTCQSLASKPVWLDRFPDSATIKATPYIKKIWHKSRFIFDKRRGIENIIYILKKFLHVSF